MERIAVVLGLTFTMLLASILSFPSANPDGYGAYPPPRNGDWVVTNDTIVENETIVLNGNLIVENGGSITLRNVTLKINCVENGTYHIEVQQGGAMYILEGSNITSNTPGGAHRFNFWVREEAEFEMRDSELHECGYYIDYYVFETKGLYLEADNVHISNSHFSDNHEGPVLNNSNYSIISNCTFTNNALGIDFNYGNNNILSDCIFTNNSIGIYSWESDNNSIINCDFINNHFATHTLGFTNASVINNTFKNNKWAANSFSSGCILRNNTLINNTYNLVLPDIYFPKDLDIDTSNTVDGAPIYYLHNLMNVEISPDTGYNNVGYLAIIDSQNITVKNLLLHNNGQGLLLMNSSSCSIENVSFVNNIRGLALLGSSYNQINNCDMQDNAEGILLWLQSSNNTIINCQVINIRDIGIWMDHESSGNMIDSCNISIGSYGFWIARGGENNTVRNCDISFQTENGTYITSDNNVVYHNNFISNNNHAISGRSTNRWHNNNFEGNYWDDYGGLDNGESNRSAGDGIGDTDIPHLEVDNYPFTERDGWFNYSPFDMDGDDIPDMIDSDDDNDGYNDTIELSEGTDPQSSASIPSDYDNDFIPDSTDPDIDNDGFPNEMDKYPFDENKWKEDEDLPINILIGIIIIIVIIIGIGIMTFKRKKTA